MVRMILGIVAGFAAWSILWVGGEETLRNLGPEWYRVHALALEKAAFNKTSFDASPTILLIYLIRSVITSLIAGYLAALIANESTRTTVVLGVILLIVGVIFQMQVWNVLPLWYNLAFLVLLIPVTVAGGRLKRPG